jgi:peroxiredoxin
MCSFRDSVAKLSRLNAQVVGISVNDPFTLKGFAERNSLNFPLLSDYRRTAITEYGVQLPDFAGLKGYTVAQRSIFIIDRDEKVRFSWVAADPSIEPDYKLVEEELRKIE